MMARLLAGRTLRGFNAYASASVFVQPIELTSVPDRRARVRFAEALIGAIITIERFAAREMLWPDVSLFFCVEEHEDATELIWESRAPWLSRAAARIAFAGMMESLPSRTRGDDSVAPTFSALMARLRRKVRRRQWSITTAPLVNAARAHGLPHEVLAGNYLRIGEGVTQHVVADVARLNQLVATGAAAGIPTVLVVGDQSMWYVARSIARQLQASHEGVGLATRGNAEIDGQPIDRIAAGRGSRPEFLLGDPRLRILVGALSTRTIARRGLGFERISIAVLLTPAKGGESGYYRVGVDVAIRAATNAVVIGADNPHVHAALEARGPARVLVAKGNRAIIAAASRGARDALRPAGNSLSADADRSARHRIHR
jgi:hypothetical protein